MRRRGRHRAGGRHQRGEILPFLAPDPQHVAVRHRHEQTLGLLEQQHARGIVAVAGLQQHGRDALHDVGDGGPGPSLQVGDRQLVHVLLAAPPLLQMRATDEHHRLRIVDDVDDLEFVDQRPVHERSIAEPTELLDPAPVPDLRQQRRRDPAPFVIGDAVEADLLDLGDEPIDLRAERARERFAAAVDLVQRDRRLLAVDEQQAGELAGQQPEELDARMPREFGLEQQQELLHCHGHPRPRASQTMVQDRHRRRDAAPGDDEPDPHAAAIGNAAPGAQPTPRPPRASTGATRTAFLAVTGACWQTSERGFVTMETSDQPADDAAIRLVVVDDHTIRTFPLQGARWVVGRGAECDLRLRDPAVSRRHVLLERDGGGLRFTDLGGVNPVLLDGRIAQSGPLQAGQVLLVGMTRLLLDRPRAGATMVTDPAETLVIAREDLALAAPAVDRERGCGLDPIELSHVFAGMEWAVADLGAERDVAEPLLELALHATNRRHGVLGRFADDGAFVELAAIDHGSPQREIRVPPRLLAEARGASEPFLALTQVQGEQREQLLAPLGPGPAALLLLGNPRRGAASGQPVLQLARTLGALIWQRLCETRERATLRAEVTEMGRRRALAHEGVLASGRLQGLRAALRDAAAQGLPVLLLGEAGTETAALARYVHSIGLHIVGPFVPFDGAQVPAERATEELFGAGPVAPGALERALGGTLFVDGPERLPGDCQQRLARCLRERRLERSGRVLPLELQLVAATDRDPHADTGSWQPELVAVLGHRKHVVPPLRLDARDVQTLADLFLAELGPAPGGGPRSLSSRARRALTDYAWPGNVRELRAVLEQAAARAGNEPIAPRHLPDHIAPADDLRLDEIRSLEAMEIDHIRDVLERVGGNRSRAAQVLGIAASTLYDKLKRYGLGSAPAGDAGQ